MTYNSKLENNTTSLQAILETVNNLPEANAAPRKVTVHFLNVYDDSSFQLWYFDESFNLMKATSNTTVTTMAGIIINYISALNYGTSIYKDASFASDANYESHEGIQKNCIYIIKDDEAYINSYYGGAND